jgi:hypothetical protein
MSRSRSLSVVSLSVVCVALLAPTWVAVAAGVKYTVTEIGDVSVRGISAAGEVVCGGGKTKACIWSKGRLRELPMPKETSKSVRKTDYNPEWLNSAVIGDNGDVAVSYESGLAFVWHGNGYTPLEGLSDFPFANANSITAQGTVLGYCATEDPRQGPRVRRHAVAWHDGKLRRLAEPDGALESEAYVASGGIVYGVAVFEVEPWRGQIVAWDKAGAKLLPLPDGAKSMSFLGANDHGMLAASTGLDTLGTQVWRDGVWGPAPEGPAHCLVAALICLPEDCQEGLRSLVADKVGGWSGCWVDYANARGQVAGHGKNPAGEKRAFFATPHK